jgi:hypothetical protein
MNLCTYVLKSILVLLDTNYAAFFCSCQQSICSKKFTNVIPFFRLSEGAEAKGLDF